VYVAPIKIQLISCAALQIILHKATARAPTYTYYISRSNYGSIWGVLGADFPHSECFSFNRFAYFGQR